jgi:effector-binding domain-containing protein
MVSPVTTYHCEVKELPSRLVLCIRLRTPLSKLPQRLGGAYGAITAYLADHLLAPAGDPFVAYYNMDMQDLDIEAVIPVARKLPGRGNIQCREFPGGKAAICLHVGPYSQVGAAYEVLNEWLKANQLQGTGIAYEFYLNDPAVTPPEALKTEIAMPLKAA